MNKKEINEIKKNFNDDCGFFTVNNVVTAFVDAEKNKKCKTNQLQHNSAGRGGADNDKLEKGAQRFYRQKSA